MLFLIAVAVLIAIWTGYLVIAVAWQEKRFPGKYVVQFGLACCLLAWVVIG